MSPTITTVSPPTILGEGPHWDEVTQSLYFTDILKSTIHRYVPETDQHTSTKVQIPGHEPTGVSIIIPVKNEKDKFVITYGTNVVLITWDGINEVSDYKILSTLTEEDATVTRINDGKCSPSGVLFAGSMPMKEEQFYDKLCHFYAFKSLKPKNLLQGIGISNGIAWSSDEKIIYYNDSITHQVSGFDYDAESNEISNRRTIFSFAEHNIEAFPDGMTIDSDGNLWVACFSASRVLKIDPKTGTLLDTISFPTANITSVAFGGKNLDELYVTSATYQPLHCEIKDDDTTGGCTFKVTGIGSKGIAGVPIDLSNLPQN